MPNKKIYLEQINEIEERIGKSFIDRNDMEKKLQNAWKADTSQAKTEYLSAYRELFQSVLKEALDRELSIAYNARSLEAADFKKCLLKTDETLKMCAMSLIPELRENEDVLSNMTFGVMNPSAIKTEIISARNAYLPIQQATKVKNQRKADAYKTYKETWLQASIRSITNLVEDKDALELMSREEKVNYALALEAYYNDPKLNPPLGLREKDLIKEALLTWKAELGFGSDITVEESVAGEYFQFTGTLKKNDWIDTEVAGTIEEYNKTINPAKAEVAHYKQLQEKSAAEVAQNKIKGATIASEYTEDTAEILGEFFMKEELPMELEERANQKQREFIEENVAEFIGKYAVPIDVTKLRTSIEQLSVLMIQAREEKEGYFSKDSVVVVENGVEKHYTAKEYFKKDMEAAHKAYIEKLTKVEEERAQAKQNYDKLRENIEKQNAVESQETQDKLIADGEKVFKDKNAELDKAIADAKKDLEKALEKMQGGIVIEKTSKEVKEHKASQYYETHETSREQEVYGEYQMLYSGLFKRACKNAKEQNYPEGKVTDFSMIAKDIDKLFKSALYVANVYDDEKNAEIVQKCSFGAFSAEQLASFSMEIEKDPWTFNQMSEDSWKKQSTAARRILTGLEDLEKKNPKMKTGDHIKTMLNEKRTAFERGAVLPKEMLDYMIAATAHINDKYSTPAKRFFNFIQYNRAQNALNACRAAMGLTKTESLRTAMNKEYMKIAGYMNKDDAFKGMRIRMNHTPNFKDEKLALQQEHQALKDKIMAEKTAQLEQLKSAGREPISLPQLDEREVILNQKPRVQPIKAPMQAAPDLQRNAK